MTTPEIESVMADFREAMAISRVASHRLLDQVGPRLSEELRTGKLLLGVDRGYARQFLSNSESAVLGREHGVGLHQARMVMNMLAIMNMLAMMELFSIFALILLAFSLLGWWGLAVLVLLPFLVWWSWRSAQVPRYRNRFPVLLAIASLGYGAYTIYERYPALDLLAALVGFVLFATIIAKYAYPTSCIRRLVLDHPQLRRALIDADVIVLCRPD